jgi:hypothetical protein
MLGRNRLVTGGMRVGRVFGVCAVGSAGVPARRKLKVESFLTQRRRDAEILRDGGVIAAEGRDERLLVRGQADACPSQRSAVNPETIILPHSGRRLVGTLALQIMLIMSIMSKINLKPSQVCASDFCKTRCCGRGRPRSRLSALPFARNA